MGVQLFAWFIFVLLASHIQYVHCPSFDSCRDHSSDLSEDPCGNSTVTVSTYLSPNDTILPWISFILSCFIFIVPLTETYDLYVEYHRPSFFLMCGMICEDTKIIGWIAVALGVLHYFRIASTAYYDSFNVILFSSSVLGCCNGFLWLYHPRLCISFEYKVIRGFNFVAY